VTSAANPEHRMSIWRTLDRPSLWPEPANRNPTRWSGAMQMERPPKRNQPIFGNNLRDVRTGLGLFSPEIIHEVRMEGPVERTATADSDGTENAAAALWQ